MKFDPSIVQTRMASPLGDILLGATRRGLAGVWFTDQRHRPDALDFKNVPHAWPTDDRHPVLRAARRQLDEFFAGQRQAFDLDFDISGGTEFQQSVWHELLKIPCGAVTTYGAVARQMGKSAAVRAVGMAVGRNPLGVIIPCHRVLGANRTLTGYAGGLQRKIWLLRHEGIELAVDERAPERSTLLSAPAASVPQSDLFR
ncbi:MAG: hypothetical protein RLZZ126_916 [Pseudomonadota bacterium]|jgi:methylated-DNA-[protein]-cysteine S-methyltransferase